MTVSGLTVSATVRIRTNLATNHLRSATHAGRDAYIVEQAHLNEELGPWFDEMTRLIPVAIIMAAAALEANANEIIQDILDGFTTLPRTGARNVLLKELKKEAAGNAMDRHRKTALLFDVEPDLGSVEWQEAKRLIAFRNLLMHFKPAWDDDKIHHGDLVRELRSRVGTVPQYSPFRFPYGLMTYRCTKWSVTSVLNFSARFCELLGVENRFARDGCDFSLP